MTKGEWFERNGFNADGYTYGVCGDNTYVIKDYLKQQGCKYSPVFRWHCADPSAVELPDGYTFCSFYYEDFMVWNPLHSSMEFFPHAQEYADSRIMQVEDQLHPHVSEYLEGEVGDKINSLTVTLQSKRGFNSRFGWTNVLTFVNGTRILTWFTETDPDVKEGCAYLLSGTIKKFEIYKGDKTTLIKRCKLQEIG